MRKIKKIVDLSWEFTAETPIYPGDPEPSVTVATTLENEGYNLSTLVMGTQTGTHVDAPYHFSNSGETIDNMELDFFLGEAVVVRVTDKKADEAITLEDIEPYKEEICEGKIVLFNTNWYKTRGTDEFFHHPYVNGDVAKYLVDNGVRFIGIDTINADHIPIPAKQKRYSKSTDENRRDNCEQPSGITPDFFRIHYSSSHCTAIALTGEPSHPISFIGSAITYGRSKSI